MANLLMQLRTIRNEKVRKRKELKSRQKLKLAKKLKEEAQWREEYSKVHLLPVIVEFLCIRISELHCEEPCLLTASQEHIKLHVPVQEMRAHRYKGQTVKKRQRSKSST